MDLEERLPVQINTSSSGHGFELNRLVSPSIDEFSMDFCCGICKSKASGFVLTHTEIVNSPVECSQAACGSLYCSGCVEDV